MQGKKLNVTRAYVLEMLAGTRSEASAKHYEKIITERKNIGHSLYAGQYTCVGVAAIISVEQNKNKHHCDMRAFVSATENSSITMFRKII